MMIPGRCQSPGGVVSARSAKLGTGTSSARMEMPWQDTGSRQTGRQTGERRGVTHTPNSTSANACPAASPEYCMHASIVPDYSHASVQGDKRRRNSGG
jgi:hypothetical protein